MIHHSPNPLESSDTELYRHCYNYLAILLFHTTNLTQLIKTHTIEPLLHYICSSMRCVILWLISSSAIKTNLAIRIQFDVQFGELHKSCGERNYKLWIIASIRGNVGGVALAHCVVGSQGNLAVQVVLVVLVGEDRLWLNQSERIQWYCSVCRDVPLVVEWALSFKGCRKSRVVRWIGVVGPRPSAVVVVQPVGKGATMSPSKSVCS